MESFNYEIEARERENHWWFVVRQKFFAREIRKLGLARNANILDLGTSTGTNLQMLKDLGFTNVTGLDLSPEAIRFCAQKGLGPVIEGSIESLPFTDNAFDLVLATDVIEHVDHDLKAVSEINRVLRPNGRVILTVPAFPSLWGLQDEVSHHKRRYRMKPLKEIVRQSGLREEKNFYFNYLLFLPIFVTRQILSRKKHQIKNENEINSPMINSVLKWVFSLDVLTAPFLKPVVGVSAYLLARKSSSTT